MTEYLRPISPPFDGATAGLNRSTWPHISVTPARRAASTMSRPSSTEDAIGFQRGRESRGQCRRSANLMNEDASARRWSRRPMPSATNSSGLRNCGSRSSRWRAPDCAGSGSTTPTSGRIRQTGQHAGMVAASRCTDDPDAQCALGVGLSRPMRTL